PRTWPSRTHSGRGPSWAAGVSTERGGGRPPAGIAPALAAASRRPPQACLLPAAEPLKHQLLKPPNAPLSSRGNEGGGAPEPTKPPPACCSGWSAHGSFGGCLPPPNGLDPQAYRPAGSIAPRVEVHEAAGDITDERGQDVNPEPQQGAGDDAEGT